MAAVTDRKGSKPSLLPRPAASPKKAIAQIHQQQAPAPEVVSIWGYHLGLADLQQRVKQLRVCL